MPQYARPISDVSAGSWTSGMGGALYAMLDETVASDGSDVIISGTNVDGDTARVNLGAVNDPISSVNHILRVRARRSGGPANGGWIDAKLYSGGVLIGTFTLTAFALTSTFQTFTFTLTGTQADAIGNYADLDVALVNVTNGFNMTSEVSWVEFEVPIPMVDVFPPFVASGEAAYAPRVEMFLSPPFVASAETAFAPRIDRTLSPGFVASGEQAFTPEVVGPRDVSVEFVATAEAAYAPTVEHGPNRVVEPPFVASAEAAYAPRAQRDITPPFVASAEAAFAPTVEPVQVVFAPFVDTSAQAYRPLVLGGSVQLFGIMDDVRIMPTPPADADIRSRARRELDPDEAADAALYLKFTEGTGATAFDSSGNGNNGTLQGTAQWVGFEGTPDLAGTRKPRVWGVRRMRKGVLEDAQRNVFRLNLGATQQIVPRENGLASLVYDGDFPSIYDWTSAPGHYATELARGRVRLHEIPPGTLAFDVLGNVDPVNGYTDVTAEIMRDIVVNDGGLSALGGIDDDAIAYAASQRPDAVGISTGDGPVTIMSVLNDLAGGVDGWWTLLRSAKFTIGLRGFPGPAEFELTVDNILEDGLECVATSVPVRQWTLSYREHEVTVELEDVAGAIPEDERSGYTKDKLFAQSPDLGEAFVRKHKDARYATGRTLYDDAAACRREAERRHAIDRHRWDVYKAALPRGVFQYRVGQPGRIVFPRFGLSEGNNYLVGGHEEATETGAVALYLWGLSLIPNV